MHFSCCGKVQRKNPSGGDGIYDFNGMTHSSPTLFILIYKCAENVLCLFFSYSCEKEEMEEFVLQLLVLSHVYMVPHLKRECEQKLEMGLLILDNVVDVFQLALLCDAPRLSLICHRKMLKNFKSVSESEGWKAMKQSHPVLEKEVLESVVDEENVSLFFCPSFIILNYHRS